MRFGAGVKGKVVESLLKGVPVVTTPIGSQGLSNIGNAISSSNGKVEFAANVLNLYRDQEKWQSMRDLGLCYFENNFSEEKVLYHIEKIFS